MTQISRPALEFHPDAQVVAASEYDRLNKKLEVLCAKMREIADDCECLVETEDKIIEAVEEAEQ